MIGYDPDHFPIGAVCNGCGAGMPRADPALTASAEVVTWFSQAFAAHLTMKHADQSPVTAVTVDDLDFEAD